MATKYTLTLSEEKKGKGITKPFILANVGIREDRESEAEAASQTISQSLR